jgi:ribosomal protein L37AE/L43A
MRSQEMQNNDICINCQKEKENKLSVLCTNCAPFIYEKGKFPHQKITKTRKWKENREEKLKLADYKCKWCNVSSPDGSYLAIHHLNRITTPSYKVIWDKVVNKIVNNVIKYNDKWNEILHKMNSSESLKEEITKIENEIREKAKKEKLVNSCPNCKSSNVQPRKKLKPKWRCANCRKEFDKIIKRPTKIYDLNQRELSEQAIFNVFSNFKLKIIVNFYDKLKKEYDIQVEKLVQNYLSMVGTVVICNDCHKETHK